MSIDELSAREARTELFRIDDSLQDQPLKVYVVLETDLDGGETTCWNPMLHRPTDAQLDAMIQADINDIFEDEADRPSLAEYKTAYSFEVEERFLSA